MTARRAAVYNRYWHSKGGGERHSGKLAEVLAADGWAVDLLGHSSVDRDELAAHLALDLSATTLRTVPYRGDTDVAALSTGYDLFVNASHMSRVRPRARHNAYLCYFPTPLDFDKPGWIRLALRHLAPRVAGADRLGRADGWFDPEGGARRAWTWTNGNAVLTLPERHGGRLRLAVARPGGPDTTLTVTDDDGRELARLPVTARFTTHDVAVDGGARIVRLGSDTFAPGGDDPRELGVAVTGLAVAGASGGWRAAATARWPWLLRDPADVSFLDSYDLVLANSEFTREWIRRLWRRDAEVLFPPIRTEGITPAPGRGKTVVSVGRFFRPGTGHAKRQLEMVRLFGELALPGWTLHVAGGVEPAHEPYLREVRAAAAGLPVEVHPNAPRALVERLLAEGAVFWSATGFGEPEGSAPWNQEHFGMTTVEAMAGGCVPVVIDRAGQREIVRDGVDGFRWATREEWAERTRRVVADEALRARLSAAAVERAAAFSDKAFARRWRELARQAGFTENR